MSQQRVMGIVVLVIGIALLVVGLTASHSAADRASDFWTGRFAQATTWYIIGGIGLGVLGLLTAVYAGRRSNA